MLDLKPGNVLLDGQREGGSIKGEDRAVLADFGLARTLRAGMSRVNVRASAALRPPASCAVAGVQQLL